MSRSAIPVIPLEKCLIATDLHCNGGARRLIWLKGLLQRCRELDASLLILGDLFDLWCGDDHMLERDYAEEIASLRNATRGGTRISMIPGNRDFLAGRKFESETGVQVHGDAVELQWAGERWHCSHGDLFGSEDRGYQRLRVFLRHPLTRNGLKILPLAMRRLLAGGIRSGSRRSVNKKTTVKMQPDLRMVEGLVAEGYDRVLCGHFHVSRKEVIHCAGRKGEFHILEPFEDRGAYLALFGDQEKLEWARKA
ncbi:hypothetical protein CBD41_04870 [bacterium TMED181]|nr:hypothetical protein [Planctomycetota bacterium]OUW44881.1 MAG: hypothetical protein CBD41_04870 [bacterium TMED181]